MPPMPKPSSWRAAGPNAASLLQEPQSNPTGCPRCPAGGAITHLRAGRPSTAQRLPGVAAAPSMPPPSSGELPLPPPPPGKPPPDALTMEQLVQRQLQHLQQQQQQQHLHLQAMAAATPGLQHADDTPELEWVPKAAECKRRHADGRPRPRGGQWRREGQWGDAWVSSSDAHWGGPWSEHAWPTSDWHGGY